MISMLVMRIFLNPVMCVRSCLNIVMGMYFRNAVHFLCLTLAKEMRKKDEKLALLREGDRIQRELSQQQQQLARSTMALAKNHRTKFVTDRHQLVYRSTDSTPEVQQELSLANERLRAEKAQQERASMTRLSNTVDQLAKKYDRYNLLTHTNVLNTRCVVHITCAEM